MQQIMSAPESEVWVELAGERRQVTALFYDIVGSTELLLNSDPEYFATIQGEVYKQAADIIDGNKGFVYQNVGDGGLCYFGYPVSLEDSAERAIRAGLALVERARDWQKALRAKVLLRIGIATSVVVIKAGRNEIVGAAAFLASRLQMEAEANSILVSDLTHELAGKSFVFEFVKAAHLKGFHEPVQVWRPVGPRKVSDRFSTHRRSESPLHGRTDELATLRGAWSKAKTGIGQSVFVTGEGGIGKSRLIAELRREIEREAAGNTLVFQCQPYASNNPLHPVASYLAGFLGDEGPSTGNVVELSPRLGASGIRVATQAIRTVSKFFSAKRDQTSSHIYGDPAEKQSRDRLITAAIQLVCASAEIAPQLILFEDVHWADSLTLDLIQRLIVAVSKMPVLVLVSQRGQVSGKFADLQNTERVTLAGLSEAAMRELIASLWSDRVPRGLVAFVQEKSDGVPLFGEELVGFLSRRVAAGERSNDWNKLLRHHGIDSLNDLVSARLDELGDARRSAQVASVIGREFTGTLLARLSDAPRPPQAVEGELEELVRHHILEVKETDGQKTYRFRHILIQEAAYASLLQADCQLIHHRIARIVVTGDATGLPDDLAASHCAQGGYPADAVVFAVKAAEACLVRWAVAEADRLLTIADEQLELLAAGHRRTELLLDVLELRGLVSAARFGEGAQETRAIYERAISICRRQGDRAAGSRFALYWGWWLTAPSVGDQRKRARTLIRDTEKVNDPEIRLQSFHCSWATNFHAAQHEYCLDCVERGLLLYDPERALRSRAIFGGHDAKVCGLGERALSLALMGARVESEAAIEACLAWAEDIDDHAGSLLHALYYAVIFHRIRQNHEQVITAADRIRDIAEARDVAPARAKADMYGGWAEMASGRYDKGMRRFEEGLQLQLKAGIDDNMSMHLDMQAEVLELAGEVSRSFALLDQAITRSRSMGETFWLAELHRHHTNLRAKMGESAANLRHGYGRALKIAEKQGAHELADRILVDLQQLTRAAPSGQASK